MTPLRDSLIAALRKVQDPEIPVNLYDLGLIYDLDIGENGVVHVRMTLTTPNCPVAESMPGHVQRAIESVAGVTEVKVELVWEPSWSREMMTEDARAVLEMMGIDWTDSGPSAAPTSLTVGKSGKRKSE